MKISWVLFLVLILISCTQKEEKVLDMQDIAPQAEGDYDQKETLKKADTLSRYWDEKLGDSLNIHLDSIVAYTENSFIDRFLPVKSSKLVLYINGQSVEYFNWEFKDSIQTNNALFNWLDCFGEKCKSHRIGEDANFQKNGFLLFVSGNQLIYISSDESLAYDTWIKYVVKKHKLISTRWLLEQKPRSKVKWYSLQEDKKTLIDNRR